VKGGKSKLDWSVFDAEHATANAHHEAAHAVSYFICGMPAEHLVHISMIGDDDTVARIRRTHCIDALLLSSIEPATVPPELADVYRRAAIRESVFGFAGPAADNRFKNGSDDWFQDMCDNGLYLENTDFSRPLEYATNILRTGGLAWHLLRTAARWTDELLDVPRVWNTITALANRLAVGKIMPGHKAFGIMESAWGGSASSIPVLDLGIRWRRRFFGARPSAPADLLRK
jgi:hypothetical protein